MSLQSLISGLVNIALFALPVPLLAWLDRPKALADSGVVKRGR